MTERWKPLHAASAKELDILVRSLTDRAEKAEATIQRVRDVCDLWQRRHDSSIRHPANIPAVAIVAVLRALDGDGDA